MPAPRRTRMLRIPSASLALASLVLLAACSTEEEMRAVDPAGSPSATATATGSPTAVPAADGPVSTRGLVMVMDTGRPELCLGPVAESFPPQCSGLPLKGWDWADHEGVFEQQGDVRWGQFWVTGTFDGTTFTATDAIPAALYDEMNEPVDDPLETPCPEPAGGWTVVDRATATPEALDATLTEAAQLPGYAGAWLDDSIDPGNTDPTAHIVNVAVTEDVEGAEATLRETWGGMLCVSEAGWTEAELNEIAQSVQKQVPGVLSSSAFGDVVSIDVVHDDGSIQAWVDQEYGEGVVEISSALVAAE